MTTQLSPGVAATRQGRGRFTPVQGAVGVGGFLGPTERGPFTPQLIASPSHYAEVFGGELAGSYVKQAVDVFFEQGGSQCMVLRIAHYTDPATASTLTALEATTMLQNSTPTNTLLVSASSAGVWGNTQKVTTTREDTLVATVTASAGAATSLTLSSVDRIVVGEQLAIDTERGVVTAIDAVTKVVQLQNAVTVPGGGWSAEAVTAERLTVISTNVNGQVEMNVQHARMSSLAGQFYVENLVNSNGAYPVTVAEQGLTASAAVDPRPANVSNTALGATQAGTNGGTVVDADYVGDQTAETGLYALDSDRRAWMWSAPGNSSSTVNNAIELHTSRWQDFLGIVEVPSGQTASQVLTYIQTTANLAGRDLAAYWPWAMRFNVSTNMLETFPVSAYVQGIASRIWTHRGFGKAPAGYYDAGATDGFLRGVTAMERKVKTTEADLLYPAGINTIQPVSGGFAVMGSRTLDATGMFQQINGQMIGIQIKRWAVDNLKFILFEPNDENTAEEVKRLVSGYLEPLRENKTLAGATSDESYYIDFPNLGASTKMTVVIGYAWRLPVEFVDVRIEEDARRQDTLLAISQV